MLWVIVRKRIVAEGSRRMPEWWEHQIKGIPKSEKLCTQICNAESRLIYAITRDKNETFKLYAVDGCKATYTKHKADSPLKLDRRIWN